MNTNVLAVSETEPHVVKSFLCRNYVFIFYARGRQCVGKRGSAYQRDAKYHREISSYFPRISECHSWSKCEYNNQ